MAQHICKWASILSLFFAADADGHGKIAGYVPVHPVASFVSIGAATDAMAAALKETTPNWAAATAEFDKISTVLQPPAGGDELFKVYSSYYGSDNYVKEFVGPVLSGGTLTTWKLDDKGRMELIMKGTVLQGVLMASISHLQLATKLCKEGEANNTNVAHVDHAWALYAGSLSNGPIKLAEKRAPQFATEANASEAGVSKVNVRLLALFKQLQHSSLQGSCTAMRLEQHQAISQMQIPIIQGMLREAYEVDPAIGDPSGDDGFIEVVEGWAFARAVLPAIAQCSPDAAKAITVQMDTIAQGADGVHMPGGMNAVKSAVESTYQCLGIKCSEVSAMVNPTNKDLFLWEPCVESSPWDTSEAMSKAVPLMAVLSVVMAFLG